MLHHNTATKLARVLFIVLVIVPTISSIASALGISPANKVINFIPNKEETITFNLINNENNNLTIFVEATGELAKYIQIPNSTLPISRNEKIKELELKIKLPERFEKPGLIESAIKISYVSDAANGATQISTMPSIKAKVQLRVPFPSKYLESKLIIEQDNEKTRFVMPIFNYGSQRIDNAKAIVKIFSQNNLIKELETESASMYTGSQAKLSAAWNADAIGSYYATASIVYDGEKLELKDSFDVGSPFVNITKIIVNNFKLGGIAKFDIYLKSDWNDAMNAYADASIHKGTEVYSISKTNSVELLPQKEGFANLYWDTANAAEGYYNLSLVIKYPKGESGHSIQLMVSENSITTGQMPKKKIIKTTALLGAIIIFLLIVALRRIHHKRRRKKPVIKKQKIFKDV